MKIRFSLPGFGVAAAIAVAGLLSGCFFDDDDNDNVAQAGPTSQVPSDASQSITGFITYLQALVASNADGLEPVDTSSVTPPVDDMAEPALVN